MQRGGSHGLISSRIPSQGSRDALIWACAVDGDRGTPEEPVSLTRALGRRPLQCTECGAPSCCLFLSSPPMPRQGQLENLRSEMVMGWPVWHPQPQTCSPRGADGKSSDSGSAGGIIVLSFSFLFTHCPGGGPCQGHHTTARIG